MEEEAADEQDVVAVGRRRMVAWGLNTEQREAVPKIGQRRRLRGPLM